MNFLGPSTVLPPGGTDVKAPQSPATLFQRTERRAAIAFGVVWATLGLTLSAALIEWGRAHLAELCEDCVRRLNQNPLRLLDCKQPGCLALRETAPRMVDHTCADCRAHFDRVLDLLAAEGVATRLQPYMVRGLDYYCRTAFEVGSLGRRKLTAWREAVLAFHRFHMKIPRPPHAHVCASESTTRLH